MISSQAILANQLISGHNIDVLRLKPGWVMRNVSLNEATLPCHLIPTFLIPTGCGGCAAAICSCLLVYCTMRQHTSPSFLNRCQLIELGTLERAVNLETYLDHFSPIDRHSLSSSKASTHLFDPIPTWQLIEVFPLTSRLILNMMNLSVTKGYVPQP